MGLKVTGSEFALNLLEIMAVFLLLSREKQELDPVLARLRHRLEQRLYQQLTIEEFERLEEHYRKKIDFESPAS